MPTPRKNESKDDFISRCIPIVIEEGRTQVQAIAICYDTWRESKKTILQTIWEKLFPKTMGGYNPPPKTSIRPEKPTSAPPKKSI